MHSKKNKFGVSAKADRTYNGMTYASKKEMTFRKKLDLLCSAKDPKERVTKIEEQVVFKIEVNKVKICDYRLDFRVSYEDGQVKHFDVKGMTAGTAYTMFQYKQRLMKAIFDIDVLEV